MDKSTDRILWSVLVLAIGVSIFVFGKPAFSNIIHDSTHQLAYVTNKVDASSNSDFSYSAPNTADDTISITGYKGHEENLVIPEYRKIGSVYYKVTSISNFAFKYNTNIKQVTIPDGLRTIGMSSFLYASNLKSLTLGSDVTSIGDCAFANTALTRVDFPASVTSIGYHTFNDTPISAISFRKCVNLGWGSFTNTKLTSVTLPTGSTCNGLSLDANTIKKVFDPNVTVTFN